MILVKLKIRFYVYKKNFNKMKNSLISYLNDRLQDDKKLNEEIKNKMDQ